MRKRTCIYVAAALEALQNLHDDDFGDDANFISNEDDDLDLEKKQIDIDSRSENESEEDSIDKLLRKSSRSIPFNLMIPN
jgi:hypothetical protein